jgi:hypothetical protein
MNRIIPLTIVIIIAGFLCNVYNNTKVEVVSNCKIIELQQQNIIHGTDKNISTEIRYLVVTDKETFICESSIFNGKFNNSDIFFRLKKDSTYNFEVCGIGKSWISDYRNILSVKN